MGVFIKDNKQALKDVRNMDYNGIECSSKLGETLINLYFAYKGKEYCTDTY